MNNIIFNNKKENFSYKESIKICYKIINTNYENFPIYMFFLNKKLMDDFASIYAFSRCIDYIGDELEANKVIDGFEIWKSELNLAYKGKATNPIFIALEKTIKKHNLSKTPFKKLIKANLIDQDKKKYKNLDELMHYCDHSANPVGEIVLNILGYKEKSVVELSNKICSALQITNFIQDIEIDQKKNRTYVPQNLLKKHKVDFAKVNNYRTINDKFKENLEQLIDELVDINKKLYKEGEKLISFLNKRDSLIIQIFISSGESILKKIEKRKVDIFFKKPQTNSFEKIIIIIKSIFKTYLYIN